MLRSSWIRSTLCCGVVLMAMISIVERAQGEEADGPQLPGKFSGEAEFLSDYVFRGFTQTSSGPAAQAELDWKHESGFHVGTRGSNVHFDDEEGSLQQQFHGGYETDLGDFELDAEAYYSWYPQIESDYDYWEFPLEIEYDAEPFKPSVSVSYSPDYYDHSGNAVYATARLELALPLGNAVPIAASLDGSFGYTHSEKPLFNDRDYVDWSAGGKMSPAGTWSGLGLGFHYTDTDVHRGEANARFVASLSYAF